MEDERQLDDWIESYMEYVENTEPPKLYHKWVAISTIAAVLERKCRLFFSPEMIFYPNFYVVLVGPSGKCRKGTAMGVGARLLRDVGIELAAEAVTREALIRELKNRTDQEVDPETGDMQFHASLTVYSQELTVFLGYNNLQLISDLTDWYDCRDHWTYRTKNMGTDFIRGVWVNLIGATTPELIRSALPQDAIGGGLSSRIIFVYQEDKEKTVAAPFLSEQELELRDVLLHDLEHIHLMRGDFHITEGFMDKYIAWYEHQTENPPFVDDRLAKYCTRRQVHLLKLCMIMSAASRTDMLVTDDIFDRALELLLETEETMPRTFGGYGRSSTAEITDAIMHTIAAERQISKEDLLKRYHTDIEDMRELMGIIDVLQNMGFCRYNVQSKTIEYVEGSNISGFK